MSYHTPEVRAAAESSYHMPEVRGGEEQPTSKERWQYGRRRAERSYSTFKVRRGFREEIPLIQGEEIPLFQRKEQRLCFDGAVVKRYPTCKVRDTQVRW